MAATYKISAEFGLEDFELIAIHSSVPDYTLAYHLNQIGGLRLAKSSQDLVLGEGVWFPVFEWMDGFTDDQWALIGNRCSTENTEHTGLFKATSSMVMSYLVEERKEVNYFLKVITENVGTALNMVKKIRQLPQLVTTYTIDIDTLKSKKNLIF